MHSVNMIGTGLKSTGALLRSGCDLVSVVPTPSVMRFTDAPCARLWYVCVHFSRDAQEWPEGFRDSLLSRCLGYGEDVEEAIENRHVRSFSEQLFRVGCRAVGNAN